MISSMASFNSTPGGTGFSVDRIFTAACESPCCSSGSVDPTGDSSSFVAALEATIGSDDCSGRAASPLEPLFEQAPTSGKMANPNQIIQFGESRVFIVS